MRDSTASSVVGLVQHHVTRQHFRHAAESTSPSSRDPASDEEVHNAPVSIGLALLTIICKRGIRWSVVVGMLEFVCERRSDVMKTCCFGCAE